MTATTIAETTTAAALTASADSLGSALLPAPSAVRINLYPLIYTDNKENHISLIYKEIQAGAVVKSNMTNGLLNGEIFAHFLIY